MDELKRCPFCGGSANVVKRRDPKQERWYVFVQCLKCRAESQSWSVRASDDYDIAMERASQRVTKWWNNRIENTEDN